MYFKFLLETFSLLIGGITVFLLGLKMMSDSVGEFAGGKMRAMLSRLTSTRVGGFLTGTAVTAVVQSSTATNIMLVSFVESGMLPFASTVAVTMGANVGTTVTAQLVSLSGSSLFNVTAVASAIGFVGFIMSLLKRDGIKFAGRVMLGFGLLFIGLEIMNKTVFAFNDVPVVKGLFSSGSPLLLMLNGLLVTGLVQSSSAVTGILILLGMNGIITFEASIYFILGTNVGACFTVMILSAGKSREARQVAMSNLLFNAVGALVYYIAMMLFSSQIIGLFEMLTPTVERKIADFHTLFNLSMSLLLLPFVKQFAKLAAKLTR